MATAAFSIAAHMAFLGTHVFHIRASDIFFLTCVFLDWFVRLHTCWCGRMNVGLFMRQLNKMASAYICFLFLVHGFVMYFSCAHDRGFMPECMSCRALQGQRHSLYFLVSSFLCAHCPRICRTFCTRGCYWTPTQHALEGNPDELFTLLVFIPACNSIQYFNWASENAVSDFIPNNRLTSSNRLLTTVFH